MPLRAPELNFWSMGGPASGCANIPEVNKVGKRRLSRLVRNGSRYYFVLWRFAGALRATPTRVEQAARKTYRKIIRGRTSQAAGAAMNTCSRVLIALCIPAGFFALARLVPRPSPAVIACRDSQDARTPCWRGTKGRFRSRKTVDPSGAVHLVRPTRVDDTDGETTASLTLAGLSRAVPLPPRPKHLNR
jgi:hypothetical protein